jgi:hypothetical protein
MSMVHQFCSLFIVMARIRKGEINEWYCQSFIIYASIFLQMEEFM